MNFKRIVGAWLGHGTVFELEYGMFALVDHEVSTSEARFSAIAGSLLRGYAENPENLPVGNCDADIAVLKALAKPGDTILFKGSRGMRMEQVLEAFLQEEK